MRVLIVVAHAHLRTTIFSTKAFRSWVFRRPRTSSRSAARCPPASEIPMGATIPNIYGSESGHRYRDRCRGRTIIDRRDRPYFPMTSSSGCWSCHSSRHADGSTCTNFACVLAPLAGCRAATGRGLLNLSVFFPLEEMTLRISRQNKSYKHSLRVTTVNIW
jgi:hypothetical protein